MNRAVVWTWLLACSFLPATAVAQDVAGLDEHLRFLVPLIGQEWEGGFAGEDASDLVISLRFETVLAGMAVKYTRRADELGYVSETHFYWSPGREEVLFLALNSRGIVGEGVASVQDGAIVLRGVDHWPDGSIEFKTLWYLDENGVLRDTFTRLEDGQWVPGHVQEFMAKDGNRAGGRFGSSRAVIPRPPFRWNEEEQHERTRSAP